MKEYLPIAITGHIDLLENDKPFVLEKIKQLFGELRQDHQKPLKLYSALAPGADTWAAECLEGEDVLVYVEPLPDDMYKKYTFGGKEVEKSPIREDYSSEEKFQNDLSRYNDLLAQYEDRIKEFKKFRPDEMIPTHKDPLADYDTADSRLKAYSELGTYLITRADVLIALWDGVYTGNPGGTSDIVHRALKSKRPIHLYQLVCPRESNPYPVANLLDKVIDFENKKFSRIPFALPFSLLSYTVRPSKELKKKYSPLRDKFLRLAVIPAVGVFLTLFFGIKGYSETYPNDLLNNFFKSLSFISLNTPVTDLMPAATNLQTARFTGFLTMVLTVIFSVIELADAKMKALRRFRWKWNKNFVLVLGLNRKSFDLIVDLNLQHEERVIVLYPDEQNVFLNDLKNLPLTEAIQGNLFSGTTLKAIGANKAKKVFIMSDSDSENIRAIQELDILDCSECRDTDRFIHLEDEGKRRFLHNSLSKNGQNRTNIFNIYENTIRRLLLYYPVDRFYLNPKIKILNAVILGFDKLGKHLALTLLKQGHYSRDKHLHITVYCNNAAQEERTFLLENPQFKKNLFGNHEATPDIYEYTWNNIQLNFEELPVSDVGWLDENNRIFKAIRQDGILNLFACMADGIQSATYLNTLLPKIDRLKADRKADVQVFCYYNFPDKKEEDIVEEYFNKIAPHTFVKCFGNYMEECSASAIQGMALDALPKMINAGYNNQRYDEAEQLWQNLSEKDKVSNRQAADHLWSKIRLVWHRIKWQFNPDTFEPTTDLLQDAELLKQYGEIEHRRWSADLLLQGFSPFDEKHDTPEYKKIAHSWDHEAGFKASHQIQKKHISLIPYDHLTEENKTKDINQITQIPEFLRRVVKTIPSKINRTHDPE